MSAFRSDQRDDDLVARVVAWHNRHPLAARIQRRHVQSQGVLGLPFAVPAGARAAAPTPAAPLPAAPEAAAPEAAAPVPAAPLPAATTPTTAEPALPPAEAEAESPQSAPAAPPPDLAPELVPELVEEVPADALQAEPGAEADALAAGADAEEPTDRPTDPPAEAPPAEPAAEPGAELGELPEWAAGASDAASNPAASPAQAAFPAEGASLRERAAARARAAESGTDLGHAVDKAAHGAAPAPASPSTAGLRRRLKPLFSTEFVSPSSVRQVARWMLRHGVDHRPGPAQAPVREVKPPAALAAGPYQMLWAYTAAVEVGMQRQRLLVGAAGGRDIFGPRLMSPWRQGLAAVVLAALAAGAGWLWQRALDTEPASPQLAAAASAASAASSSAVAAAAPASAASAALGQVATAAASASVAASAPAPAGEGDHGVQGEHAAQSAHNTHSAQAAASVADAQHGPARAHADASAPVAGAAASASIPHASAQAGHADGSAPAPAADAASAPRRKAAEQVFRGPLRGKPQLVAGLDDEERLQALQASEAARAERARQRGLSYLPREQAQAAAAAASAAAAQAAAQEPAKGAGKAAGHGAVAAGTRAVPVLPAPGSGAWAVSSRVLRTQFESEQLVAAMREVAAKSGRGSGLQFLAVPAGADWRAVGWPFANRAAAEALKAALAERGLRVQVLEF